MYGSVWSEHAMPFDLSQASLRGSHLSLAPSTVVVVVVDVDVVVFVLVLVELADEVVLVVEVEVCTYPAGGGA